MKFKKELIKKQDLHDLQLFAKSANGRTRHIKTLLFSKPYGLCKGMKTQYEANSKKHFEHLRIVKSQ